MSKTMRICRIFILSRDTKFSSLSNKNSEIKICLPFFSLSLFPHLPVLPSFLSHPPTLFLLSSSLPSSSPPPFLLPSCVVNIAGSASEKSTA